MKKKYGIPIKGVPKKVIIKRSDGNTLLIFFEIINEIY